MRAGSGARPTAYARAVLDVVDRIPAGKVMTYGDVAELMCRGSPRTVGTVLSNHGRGVPWQRVVQASGRPAEPHVQEALRLLAEKDPVKARLVDLRYFAGLTKAETAEALGISVGTVKSQASRALATLRERAPELDPRHSEEER